MVRVRKRSKLRALLVSVAIFLLCGTYTSYALFRPLPPIVPTSTFTYTHTATSLNINWPASGESAIGAVGFGVLDMHGGDTPLPTASTIKILTALAVLAQKPLQPGEAGPTIVLTQADVDSYNKYLSEDGSIVRVEVGEQLTEYQALEALLLPSANNIAETLARWAFGSMDAYNTYANQYAQKLGMTNTTVTDPSGFLPTTVSTPHDLVLLGEAAMANNVVSTIVGEQTTTIPVQGMIHNVNFLLGQEGIIGIKTGNNDQDPGVFLSAAQHSLGKQTVTIIGVVMGGPSLVTTMRSSLPMLSSAGSGFSLLKIAAAGDTIAQYHTPWTSTIHAVADSDIAIAAWRSSTVTTSVSMHQLATPKAAGTVAGTLSVHGNTIYTTPVVLEQDISRPSIIWRLVHPFVEK